MRAGAEGTAVETISSVLAQLPALFHLSPLDWIVVAILITLSFACHILRLIRMLCEECLEFKKWSRDFRIRWRDAGGHTTSLTRSDQSPVAPGHSL
jgi:hypothetical protein